MNLRVGLSLKHMLLPCYLLPRKNTLSKIAITLTVITSLATTTLGQTNTKNTTARVVDYTPAIEELLKIGFPNLKDAKEVKYVKLHTTNLEWTCSGFGFSSHRTGNPVLTGNGFHIPSKDLSKPDKFIYLGGYELAYSKSIRSSERISVSGKMTDADLSKDLASLLKWAKTASTTNNTSSYTSSTYPVVLGFASLAHQAGHKEAATEIIKTLFLNAEEPENIINTLINNLASKEYNQSYQELTQSKDWKKFHTDLVHLQTKFPRGWKNQPALEILIPQVLNRINTAPSPPPTSIGDHTFSPEILELLAKTAKPPSPTGEYYGENNLFTITPSQKKKSAPPFTRLTEHGMDGFIAIASLIGDNTLILDSSDNPSYNHYGYSSYSSYDERLTPEDAYSSLDTPPTRGSTAYDLISNALPHTSDTLSNMEPEQLKAFAITWWKEHKNDTKMELIEHYLAEGNTSHTTALVRSMLDENTDKSRQMLERGILSSQSPSQLANIVNTYVKKRKSKAKDFLQKYKDALIVESQDEDSYDMQYYIKHDGNVDKYIATLTPYTELLSSDQLLMKLAKADSNSKQVIEQLLSSIEPQDLKEHIYPIIKITVTKQQDAQKIVILSQLLEASYRLGSSSATGRSKGGFSNFMKSLVGGHKAEGARKKAVTAEAETTEKPTFTKEQQATWETLLYSDITGNGSSNISKISTITGMLLDNYTHPNRLKFHHASLLLLGSETADQIIRSRSKAILAGTPLPPLPNPDKVTSERVTEMTQLLANTAPAKQRQTLLTFTHSERIKLANNEQLQATLSSGQEYIQGFANLPTIDQAENIEQLQQILQPLIGKKIEPETFQQAVKILLENADTFASSTIRITSSSSLPGMSIEIHDQNTISTPEIKSAEKELIAGKIAALCAITTHNRESHTQYSLIFTKTTQPDNDQLQELNTQGSFTISTLTKDALNKRTTEHLATKKEREELINQIISLSPDAESNKDYFTHLSVKQLKKIQLSYQYYNMNQ